MNAEELRAYNHARYEQRMETRPEKDALTRAIILVEKRWTLGVVRKLADGPLRFNELQAALGVASESLRTTLAAMVAEDLLTRTKYDVFPIRVDYELTEKGNDLLPVVAALAGWADRWDER